MHRLLKFTSLAVIACVLFPSTSRAQSSLNFSIGGFVPLGEDSRDRDDVLLNDQDFLAFRIRDFRNATANAEWLVGLGEFVDAGLGIGIYSRGVPSVYSRFINDDNTEIEQRLHLRIVPFTATLRLLPMGRSGPIEPYFGVGVGVFNWRYVEEGDFIDPVSITSFPDRFVAKGSATGPVVLGGLQFPMGAWKMGGEIRYQAAKGELPLSETFAGSKIDLGGYSYLATFKYRF